MKKILPFLLAILALFAVSITAPAKATPLAYCGTMYTVDDFETNPYDSTSPGYWFTFQNVGGSTGFADWSNVNPYTYANDMYLGLRPTDPVGNFYGIGRYFTPGIFNSQSRYIREPHVLTNCPYSTPVPTTDPVGCWVSFAVKPTVPVQGYFDLVDLSGNVINHHPFSYAASSTWALDYMGGPNTPMVTCKKDMFFRAQLEGDSASQRLWLDRVSINYLY